MHIITYIEMKWHLRTLVLNQAPITLGEVQDRISITDVWKQKKIIKPSSQKALLDRLSKEAVTKNILSLENPT